MGTRVRLTRSGGLAGLSMVAAVDLDELPPASAEKVEAALAEMDFERPRRRRTVPAPGPWPDAFQYDIEVDDGEKRSITVHDPVISPEVRALLDVLVPLAEPE
ncbi:MAG TPA: protealysin inhibitor emfourin [Acidimicrobiales bacterium]|jgi:hypothetical protein|nr:protealysin inhibitor emfourin [Acidimicrobiales bacterium]